MPEGPEDAGSARSTKLLQCVFALHGPRLLTDALGSAINAEKGLRCVGIVDVLADAVMLVSEHNPHVLVLDASLAGGDVMQSVQEARALSPDIAVILLASARDDDLLSAAAAAGASGFLLVDTPFVEVVQAIRAASGGGMFVDRTILTALLSERQKGEARAGVDEEAPDLTARERNVLTLMGEGLEPRAIAKSLGITLNTCRGHVQRILEKFGAHSQLEAVVKAAHQGLLPGLSRPDASASGGADSP